MFMSLVLTNKYIFNLVLRVFLNRSIIWESWEGVLRETWDWEVYCVCKIVFFKDSMKTKVCVDIKLGASCCLKSQIKSKIGS